MQVGSSARELSRLAPFFLLLAAACPGGGAPASLAPPGKFVAWQEVGSFDDVLLTWQPPPGGASAYEVEARLEDGPWQGLVAVSGDVVGGVVTLDSSIPEITHFTFRIRSIRGGQASTWAEAPFLRALRWPLDAASDYVVEGIRLTWTNASAKATGVRISRQFGLDWRVMADLPASATTFVDGADLVTGQGIRYRITATAGAVESLPTERFDPGYPPRQVFQLSATAEAGGVRLRWVNPPVTVERIEIRQTEGLAMYFADPDPVILPPTATEYFDPVSGSTWTWQVASVYPLGLGEPYAQVSAVANPLGSTLQASLVSLPDASAMASDGGERIGFAVGYSYNPPATGSQRLVFRGAGSPPDVDLGANHGWAAPAVAFDPSGLAHGVVLRPVAGDPPVALVHVWHDGVAWNEEEIARRALDDPSSVRFALDAAGAVHAAWSTGAGASRAEYAHLEGATWMVEDLSPLVPADARVRAFDLDGLGVPSIVFTSGVFASGQQTLLARRDSGWTVETIPLLDASATSVGRSPAGLDLVAARCVGPSGARTGEIVHLERTGTGLWPLETVRSAAGCLDVSAVLIRRSGDGQRIVVWGSTFGQLELDLWESGTWTHVDASPRIWATSEAWFDATQKLHVVARSGEAYPDLQGNVLYIQYVEP